MIRLRPKLFRGRHVQDEIIILCVRWTAFPLNPKLDFRNHPLRLLLVHLRQQSARALGYVATHKQHRQSKHRSNAERESPTESRRDGLEAREE